MPELTPKIAPDSCASQTPEELSALASGWQALKGPAFLPLLHMLSDMAATLNLPPEEVAELISRQPAEQTTAMRSMLALCALCADNAHNISGELGHLVSQEQWSRIKPIEMPPTLRVVPPWPAREARPIAMSSVRVVAKLTDIEAEALKKGVSLARACSLLGAQGVNIDSLMADHERQSKERARMAEVFDEGRYCRIDQLSADFLRGAECIVALGGDGTLTAVTHIIRDRRAVIGVNLDPQTSRGATLQFSSVDAFMASLDNLASGAYRFEPWTRLAAKLNGTEIIPATYDYFLGSEKQYRMSWVQSPLDGASFDNGQRTDSSSGLIIGGRGHWLDHSARYLFPQGLRAPVDAPYALYVYREIDRCEIEKPDGTSHIVDPREAAWGVIFPGESLILKSLNRFGGVLVVDSEKEYRFDRGAVVEVSVAREPLWTICHA